MQALMLAAGMGKRLGKHTNSQTKCMVEVAKKTLLTHTVEALEVAGINKLILVIGYEAEKLKEYVSRQTYSIDIEFIENILYHETNNIYSLYLAIERMSEDDTILLESDLIYTKDLVKKLVESSEPNLVTVAKYQQWMDGTVTLLDEEDNICEFVEKKDFKFEKVTSYYKTVNIYKFSKEFSENVYKPFLTAYIQSYGKNQYYELVLKAISHLSPASLKSYIMDDSDLWYEIDDIQDLNIAETIFANPETKLCAYEYNKGGFWRFDGMKNYSNPVNPYFPPPQMVEHMRYMFSTLVTECPSGMSIETLLASKMFSVDEEFLLVGNGATELISVLGQNLTGSVSISVPSFNEYIRCFPRCDIRKIQTLDEDFSFSFEKLLFTAKDSDVLVIVNPDNPTGSFLPKEKILELLNVCKKNNTLCVFDESFIDFTQIELRYTLLDDEILKEFPNLVVIKSIGKSYGVPGLRLGVLASSDRVRLADIQNSLPVWNINSIGEYFFQIFGVYKKSYMDACNCIVEERNYMIAQLKKISYLVVYDSQANYIMCELIGQGSSKEFTTKLLQNSNILIKDLSQKDGFQGRNFIRIAIKTRNDNDFLLHHLYLLIENEPKETSVN